MKRIWIVLVALLGLQIALAQGGKTMKHVTGSFDVKMVPQGADAAGGSPAVGRMLLDKAFHGPLEGISKGQMLSAGDYAKGSAGYVAMEAVTGTLEGKSGTFALQHSGTMDQGAFSLTVTVVPGSGTGELTGLSGTMKIVIEGGKHSYVLDYTL